MKTDSKYTPDRRMLKRFMGVSALIFMIPALLCAGILLCTMGGSLSPAASMLLILLVYLVMWVGFTLFALKVISRLSDLARGINELASGEPVHAYEEGLTSELAESLNKASELQQRQRQMLEKRDDQRIEWIRGVSHDIRTPLPVILGHAEDMEEDEELSDDQKSVASVMKEQALKIRELIGDLNLLSKLEYNSQPLRLTDTVLAGLIRNVAAEFMDREYFVPGGGGEPVPMDRFGLELILLPEFERLSLPMDQGLIRRVLRNIIGNSMKHNPGGCSILVFAHKSEDRAFIDISDDGRGIPELIASCVNSYGSELWNEEELQHTMDEEEQGTVGAGQPHIMGMRIAKRIMLAHGGSLMVRPDLRTVSLIFPLQADTNI